MPGILEKLNITRGQLGEFIKNIDSLKQFERLFGKVDEIGDTIVYSQGVAVGTADAKAQHALDEVAALREEVERLTVIAAVAETALAKANDAMEAFETMPAPDASLLELLTSGDAYYISIDVTDSPYTVTHEFEVIVADATGGNITVNCLSAAVDGRKVWLKKTDASANTVDLASGDNIDGAATFSLVAQYENVTAISIGSTYQVIP